MSDMNTTTLTQDIQSLISGAQENAIKAVDVQRVLLYWNIGQRIFTEVQKEKDRADYGKQIIKTLAIDLEPMYGSGYSYRQLYLFLQFYKVFPIVNAVRSQLNWTQYKLLIRIEDNEKKDFENDTIGVLLCADKNETVVKYTLPEDNKTILASKYQLYLPSEKELIKELHRELEELENTRKHDD